MRKIKCIFLFCSQKFIVKKFGVSLGLMSATEVSYINLVEKGWDSGDVNWGW